MRDRFIPTLHVEGWHLPTLQVEPKTTPVHTPLGDQVKNTAAAIKEALRPKPKITKGNSVGIYNLTSKS